MHKKNGMTGMAKYSWRTHTHTMQLMT